MESKSSGEMGSSPSSRPARRACSRGLGGKTVSYTSGLKMRVDPLRMDSMK